MIVRKLRENKLQIFGISKTISDVPNKINGIKRHVRLMAWLAECSKNNFDSELKSSLSEVKTLALESDCQQ